MSEQKTPPSHRPCITSWKARKSDARGAAPGCCAPAREPRCVRACFLSITLQNKLLPTTLDMQELSFSSWLASTSPRLFLQELQKIPTRFLTQGSVPRPLNQARTRNAHLMQETRCLRLPTVPGPAAVPLKAEDPVLPAVPSSVPSAGFGTTQAQQRARSGPLSPKCPHPSPSVRAQPQVCSPQNSARETKQRGHPMVSPRGFTAREAHRRDCKAAGEGTETGMRSSAGRRPRCGGFPKLTSAL